MQDAPEKHGLSSAALAEAAAEVEQTTPYRYCLLVAKDGVIVHESYFHNTSDSVYETDSLGKSVTSALMGIPVAEGLLDIDTPIKQYGVVPQAIWSVPRGGGGGGVLGAARGAASLLSRAVPSSPFPPSPLRRGRYNTGGTAVPTATAPQPAACHPLQERVGPELL